jgi:hypothetical protein
MSSSGLSYVTVKRRALFEDGASKKRLTDKEGETRANSTLAIAEAKQQEKLSSYDEYEAMVAAVVDSSFK